MSNGVHTHNGKCLHIKNTKEVLSHVCRTLSENTYKHHSFPLKWMWILSNLKRKKGLISKEPCLPDAEHRCRQIWLVSTEDSCITEMPSNILCHNWIMMVDNKYLFQEDWAERILYILSTNQYLKWRPCQTSLYAFGNTMCRCWDTMLYVTSMHNHYSETSRNRKKTFQIIFYLLKKKEKSVGRSFQFGLAKGMHTTTWYHATQVGERPQEPAWVLMSRQTKGILGPTWHHKKWRREASSTFHVLS